MIRTATGYVTREGFGGISTTTAAAFAYTFDTADKADAFARFHRVTDYVIVGC